MGIIYEEGKGYCIDILKEKENSKLPDKILSNGFDQLPWDEFILIDDVNEHEAERKEETQIDTLPKKLTKQQKKEIKQQKKIRALRKRQMKRKEIGEENQSAFLEFNPYEALTTLKQTYSKIIKESGHKTKEDFKILHCHSVSLYKSDLEHILPEEWLNDNNISFVYELIYQYFLKQSEDDNYAKQVALLYPSLVQLFLHMPINDDIETILPMDDLKSAKFIFMPINYIDDYDGVDLEDLNNGDHWILGVLSLLENRLYVYDSMAFGENDDTTSEDHLFLQLTKRLEKCKSLVKGNRKIQVIKMACDQQDNFDDCGVYLIMITCTLIHRLLYNGHNININIKNVAYNPLSARLFMMKLIYKLASSA